MSRDDLAHHLVHPFTDATGKTRHIKVQDQDQIDLGPLRTKATTEPDDIGSSKVAVAIPKPFGPCTARNLTTMTALATMASA